MLYRNLVENAIRYAPAASEVRVTTAVRSGQVDIAVIDAGAGITPEQAEQVCQRFYRGEQASGDGAGLGLSIVQRIVERAGGTLQFRARGGNVAAAVVVSLPTR